MIPPASSVPPNFSAKCSDHLTVRYRKKASKSKRRLRQNDSEDEDEEDSEDEDEDSEESEDELEEEEEEEEEESDDERRNIIRKKALVIGKAKSPLTTPAIPTKRRASPQSLFPEDQQSSDDDDDMGTSSAKPKMNIFGNKSSHNPTSSSPINTTLSYKERLEAKRKKSALESRPSLSDDRRPHTATPPPGITQSAVVTPKQKLPNRTHLTSNNNSNNIIVSSRPGSTPPTITKRYSNGPGLIKSIDEVILKLFIYIIVLTNQDKDSALDYAVK